MRFKTTPKKAWITLVTTPDYLDGLLALDYSLQLVGSRYPLVAAYTENIGQSALRTIIDAGIPTRKLERLQPKVSRDYSNDERFNDCWTKLQVFSLYEYTQLCFLDSDMIVVQNMDELFQTQMDQWVFAATPACVCNPLKRAHYPSDWVPENCPYNHYKGSPGNWIIPSGSFGLGECNSGLFLFTPSQDSYAKILKGLGESDKITAYIFPDQCLMSDVFRDRWLALPYKYNALKTMKRCHSSIWSDTEVKNLHFILSPKPWKTRNDDSGLFKVWHDLNDRRLEEQRARRCDTPTKEEKPGKTTAHLAQATPCG